MKKEYFFIFAASLLILAYVVDSISGPVSITIKNPYAFFQNTVISRFPLTTVGIFARSLGIFVGILLTLSFIDRMFFAKAITTFFLTVFFNLFAVQQIATNTRTVTIQWILSLAYTGLALLLPTVIYLIMGFISPVINKRSAQEPVPTDSEDE